MATQPNKEGMQLRSDFGKIIDTLSDLADYDESDLNFADGKMMSRADIAMMRIFYDNLACKAFWKPYAKDAKLEAALEDHEEMVEDIEVELGRAPTETVADAYILSIQYSHFLYFCVTNATFSNPVFGGEKEDIFGSRGIAEGGTADSVTSTGPCIFEGVQ